MRYAFVLGFLLCLSSAAHADTGINAVLGDVSWWDTHKRPLQTEDEDTRIRTHLAFVSGLLRAARPKLTPDQSSRRAAALAVLETYVARGVFPRRTRDTHSGRRPRFIDDDGVHCAVGYLLAATGYEDLAARIDREDEYGHVLEMRFAALDRWAHKHGFSVLELAMIQPSYRSPIDADWVRWQVGLSDAISH